MADVLQSTAQPEISIDRWLAASMIGERCEEADALKFARDHQKSLSGGTSGILLPEFFKGQWIDGLRAHMILHAEGMTKAKKEERRATASRQLPETTGKWRGEEGPDDPATDGRGVMRAGGGR